MLTEYPEGVRVTAVLVLVFSKTRCLEPVAALEICGAGLRAGASPTAGRGGSGSPLLPQRLRGPDPLQGRAGSPRAATAATSPGESRDAEMPRGTAGAARSGRDRQNAASPGRDTTANKTPAALSAAAASPAERHRQSPRVRRGFRCGQPRHGQPGQRGGRGHRRGEPSQRWGHQRAPAGPAAQPSTRGHGGGRPGELCRGRADRTPLRETSRDPSRKPLPPPREAPPSGAHLRGLGPGRPGRTPLRARSPSAARRWRPRSAGTSGRGAAGRGLGRDRPGGGAFSVQTARVGGA